MNQSPIRYERAVMEDVPAIVKIIQTAKDGIAAEDWYVAVNEDFVRENVEQRGFIVKAMSEDTIAGFLLVHYPMDDEDNMGAYLQLDKVERRKVAHMDTACVLPAYRGMHLQQTLLEEGERILKTTAYRYSMATVHPDNRYSLRNLLAAGYSVVTTVPKYGGLLRHVVCKDVIKTWSV
ncbi:GNAT family N-acetyltransferase [Clostridium sp. D33t1_170424_F3]|uniref:GNAT family N-acetyltransferase n=1 Tax=Clostridium sp. D33t1_170424_F3 TaxID=2787099 RepID=UPI0018A9C218|nr:GNAT family N-acetyltransferase [Clostridium sp. D33t1_170424_F3]